MNYSLKKITANRTGGFVASHKPFVLKNKKIIFKQIVSFIYWSNYLLNMSCGISCDTYGRLTWEADN